MKNKGFTFVELLVVVTIIAVLSSVAIVSFQSTNRNSRDAKRKADLEQVRAALELYRAENGVYPDDVSFGSTITDGTNTYLNPVPLDPKDGQTGYGYTYNQLTTTTYQLCAILMEGDDEESPYCLSNP